MFSIRLEASYTTMAYELREQLNYNSYFLFAESTFFEYFIESVAERPSIQDLIVTPVGGYLIGELEQKVTLAMRKNGFNFAEKVFVFLINPLYVVLMAIKRMRSIITYNTNLLN